MLELAQPRAPVIATLSAVVALALVTAQAVAAPRALSRGLMSPAAAPSFSVLYTFAGGTDGADPLSAVVADAGGHLYGTTLLGGSAHCTGGCGTVYKLSSSNGRTVENVLYRFQGGTDGASPSGALYLDGSGDLFGTTSAGGSTKCASGCGTVFELVPNSTATAYTKYTIHSFTNDPDGSQPLGSLIADSAGDLFGTTSSGGSNAYGCYGYLQSCGTVFELAKTGKTYNESVLFTFQAPLDASDPGPTLAADSSGTIYGVGVNGGANGCVAPNYGCGSVFAITPFANGGYGGYIENLLLTLPAPNGTGPYAVGGVVRDTAGSLYGLQSVSTVYPFPNNGAAYKFTRAANSLTGYTETIIHNFTGVPDGSVPEAGLIADTAGSLYGTTYNGGSANCNCGTVFKLTHGSSTYTETILFSFLRGGDGSYPAAPLYEDGQGSLYGTTTSGGSFVNCTAGCGTVYKVTQ